jgi:hypothetical protein
MRSPENEFRAASGELGRRAHPQANAPSAMTQNAFASVRERKGWRFGTDHLRLGFPRKADAWDGGLFAAATGRMPAGAGRMELAAWKC